MNILVATNHLFMVGGSETFTYTLIEELIKRKELYVEYFTFKKGLVSKNIEENLNVKFMSLSKYDLIFANHNTCVKRLYKKGFIIQTCHGIFPLIEQPSRLANGHVSISEEVQTHLKKKKFESKIILNGINLNRYKPQTKPNKTLRIILSICQSDAANSFIQECCTELGIKFIAANKYKEGFWAMEKIINQADLVIGLGRSAYEGMACGRPVLIFDNRDYSPPLGDGYVKNNFYFFIKNNCSGRFSQQQFSKRSFINEINKYNPLDGDRMRCLAEKNLDIVKQVDFYFDYYFQLKSEHKNLLKKFYYKWKAQVLGQ